MVAVCLVSTVSLSQCTVFDVFGSNDLHHDVEEVWLDGELEDESFSRRPDVESGVVDRVELPSHKVNVHFFLEGGSEM